MSAFVLHSGFLLHKFIPCMSQFCPIKTFNIGDIRFYIIYDDVSGAVGGFSASGVMPDSPVRDENIVRIGFEHLQTGPRQRPGHQVGRIYRTRSRHC